MLAPSVDILQPFLSPTFVGTVDSRSLSATVADLLRRTRTLDPFSVRSGSDPLALKYRTVVDALEEIGFPIAGNLKLRDDLPAEARGTDENRDLAYALSCRRGDLKSVLERSADVADLEDLLAQQRVYKIANLNLMSAYMSKNVSL